MECPRCEGRMRKIAAIAYSCPECRMSFHTDWL